MFLLNMAQGLLELNALYLDPAATTVLATSISGIVIALGATAVVLWRKAKKKAALILSIDENAHKEVEADLVIKEDDEAVTASETHE